jgi:hypothetical protein
MENLALISDADLDEIIANYGLDSAEQSDLRLFIVMAQEGEVKQAWTVFEGASEKVHIAVDSLIRSWAE